MFKISTSTLTLDNVKLKLETGKIARQAHGSVVVSLGQTVLLCTATIAKKNMPERSLALSVHYFEKFYAAGKIPGGFVKREGKPTEKEIIIARLVDRSLRPIIQNNPYQEIQVVCTVLSYDGENSTDVAAVIGASAAVKLAGIGCDGTVAAVKIGHIDNNIVINPTVKEMEKSNLDLFVSGTATTITMVECGAMLPQHIILDGIERAQQYINNITSIIDELVHQKYEGVNLTKQTDEHTVIDDTLMANKIQDLITTSPSYANLAEAIYEPSKQLRTSKINTIKSKIRGELIAANHNIDDESFNITFDNLKIAIVRENILTKKIRIDSRAPDQIRNIDCEIDILPRVHGSALFTRGETQVLSVVTIGTRQDVQISDDITGVTSDKFMLHYNFPSYAVGEIGQIKAPGRREIGHGRLALRAIIPMLPSTEEYQHTVRIVADVTESNGSSSMATVCASSLALMASGVPMKQPVAGIAMGLIKSNNSDDYVILSDIIGDEDHIGDMDLKVAGTEDNTITALQMDIKTKGLQYDVISQAIVQATVGIKNILAKMNQSISLTRNTVNSNVPRIMVMNINKEDIRTVIGPGGKTVKEISMTCNVKIAIEDDGKVLISANTSEDLNNAMNKINSIVSPMRVGSMFDITISSVTDFGLFVKLQTGAEGFIHISDIVDGYIKDLKSIFTEGQNLKAKMIGFDRNGKIKLCTRGVSGNSMIDALVSKKENTTTNPDHCEIPGDEQTANINRRKRFL